jgi:hypothetical protein
MTTKTENDEKLILSIKNYFEQIIDWMPSITRNQLYEHLVANPPQELLPTDIINSFPLDKKDKHVVGVCFTIGGRYCHNVFFDYKALKLYSGV